MIYSLLAYLLANAAGLLVAILLLPGFSCGVWPFAIAVALFSIIQVVLSPLLTKISLKYIPQLQGGVALVTIMVCLIILDVVMPGLTIGGISNWLAATLLIWLGSLVAAILLPIYVFKELVDTRRERL